MIIAVDNVEIVVSQSSDKTVMVFVEMRDAQTGRFIRKTWESRCTGNTNGTASVHYMIKFIYRVIKQAIMLKQ